jgi:hypothetical protein
MTLIIILTKILLLAKFITSFEPLQWFLEVLELKQLNIFKYLLIVITSCFKCASFWVGWIVSGDIFIAAGASYIAYLYTQGEQNLINWIWKRKK